MKAGMRNIVNLSWKIPLLEIVLFVGLLAIAGVYFRQAFQIDPTSDFAPFVDDAFIHMRFAANYANGHGFVWNRGEPPVEGFTSFLYVVILGLVEKSGGLPILVIPYIGAACVAMSLGLSLSLMEQVNPGHLAEHLVAVIMLGLSPSLRFWSTSGLETTMYMLLLAAAAIIYIAYRSGKCPPWLVGMIFAIATLTRPEALALFAITVLFDLVLKIVNKTMKFKNTFVMVLAFSLVYVPVFIWKWSYFGYPFPNTYYAKTGAGWIQIRGGWSYLLNSIKIVMKGSLIPVFVVLLTFRWKFMAERLYLIAMMAVSWLVVVLNGGDHFGFARFLVPALPFLFVFVGLGISEITSSLPKANRVLLLSVIVLLTYRAWNPFSSLIDTEIVPMTHEKANPEKLEFFNNWDAGFIMMGKSLHTFAGPADSIAVVPIGAIGYYSDIIVLDMVGLVDPVIAHQPFDPSYSSSWRPGHDKGDGLYILSKKPDYIQLVDLLTSRPFPDLIPSSEQFKSVMEIWNSPEFHENYEFFPVSVEDGWYYNLYRRKNMTVSP